MFGLDHSLAHLSDGTNLVVVVLVAIALGLRHASDPDHLAAVTTLIVSGDRAPTAAGRLGVFWGLGHATSLFLFGLPIVLFKAYLPEPVQRAAETTVGLLIIALAVWLLVRWRRGLFHPHPHGEPPRRTRSPLQAYGIGVVHGLGGSAGVGLLLLASIHNRGVAVLAFVLFAVFTAVSMALLSTGWGLTLTRRPVARSFDRLVPALGLASFSFGVWYALGALSLAPYFF